MLNLINNLRLDKKVTQNEIDFYASDFGLDSQSFLDYLKIRGLDIVKHDGLYRLSTFINPLSEQLFCITDIETNGPNPQKHDILEIGAIKYQNGKIIDKFSSLVYANYIPKFVSNVTGITIEDVLDAPSSKKVLSDFRLFLGNSIFVAHDVKWDYNFLSSSFENHGLETMLNQKFCTLKLAQKYIKAPKYGLKTLNEILNIKANHHRAYDDAYSSYKILEFCLSKL